MNVAHVREFLNQFETCVIATVSEGAKPEAATVGFSVDDHFMILIATNKTTRKATNIIRNGNVALVVGFEGPKTVQLEGVARKIDETEFSGRIDLHYKKVPGAQKFAGDDGQSYFLITPTWLRFTDYTHKPSIFETRDFS